MATAKNGRGGEEVKWEVIGQGNKANGCSYDDKAGGEMSSVQLGREEKVKESNGCSGNNEKSKGGKHEDKTVGGG